MSVCKRPRVCPKIRKNGDQLMTQEQGLQLIELNRKLTEEVKRLQTGFDVFIDLILCSDQIMGDNERFAKFKKVLEDTGRIKRQA